MFPVDMSFVYVMYLELAVIGLFVGVVSGVLVSITLKLRVRGSAIAIDALLGATGPVIAEAALWKLRFEYPTIPLVIIAIALPALHQLSRFKRMKAGRN
jgi:hypothetical protein